MIDLSQIRQRAILACEAEAVAWDYLPEVGREIYDGICRDHLEQWTDKEYLEWSHKMSDKYGLNVVKLYARINQDVYTRYYKMAFAAVVEHGL